MMELCEAKRFIEAMMWPEGARPLLRTKVLPPEATGATHSHMQASLYRPENKWPAVKTAIAPSLEGALEIALEHWVKDYKLPEHLLLSLRRLTN